MNIVFLNKKTKTNSCKKDASLMELLVQLQAVFNGDFRGGFNTSNEICEVGVGC